MEPDAAKRIALLREAAELARKELAQPELAAEHYQALIGIDREDVEGLRSLAEIRSEQGRWNEVVGLLERLLDLVPSDERPGIARAMGEALTIRPCQDSASSLKVTISNDCRRSSCPIWSMPTCRAPTLPHILSPILTTTPRASAC